MPPPIIAAIISALVSISVVAISRWFFARTDKRFPILVRIQEKLLELQANPPTSPHIVVFHHIPKAAKPLQPYFVQLRMVSFPFRICCVQRAWYEFVNLDEDAWKQCHPNRVNNYSDGLSTDEFVAEIDKILKAIAQCA